MNIESELRAIVADLIFQLAALRVENAQLKAGPKPPPTEAMVGRMMQEEALRRGENG